MFPSLNYIKQIRKKSLYDTIPECKVYRDYAQRLYTQLSSPIKNTLPFDFNWDQYVIKDRLVPYIDLGSGAFVCDAYEFIQNYPNKADQYFFKKENVWNTRKLCALIEICWNTSIIVYVPQGVSIDIPIDLAVYVGDKNNISIEKICIIIEQDASIVLHDTCRSDNKKLTILRAIDCTLGENAQVNYLHDQNWNSNVCEVSRFSFHLSRNSELNFFSLITRGSLCNYWLDVDILGPYAHATIRGGYLLDNEQKITITTQQKHYALDGISDLVIKGSLDGNAHAFYTGSIFIDKNASGTNAAQENKNILLNQHVRAHSIPILEVLNNDVQCAHGSAIGQLDEEGLFYAYARGLNQKQAQSILLQGFFADLFANIPNDLKSTIISRILNKLSDFSSKK